MKYLKLFALIVYNNYKPKGPIKDGDLKLVIDALIAMAED